MALIKCSECDNDVSDKAAACPKCGAPVAGVKSKAAPSAAKTVKRAGGIWEAIGTLLIIASIPACVADNTGLGGTLAVIGFVVFIIGRFN